MPKKDESENSPNLKVWFWILAKKKKKVFFFNKFIYDCFFLRLNYISIFKFWPFDTQILPPFGCSNKIGKGKNLKLYHFLYNDYSLPLGKGIDNYSIILGKIQQHTQCFYLCFSGNFNFSIITKYFWTLIYFGILFRFINFIIYIYIYISKYSLHFFTV